MRARKEKKNNMVAKEGDHQLFSPRMWKKREEKKESKTK